MFQTKTLYIGNSVLIFDGVRDILDLNEIWYKYRTTDLAHNSYMSGRGTTRSMGGNFQNVGQSLIYEILVDKSDYEEAYGLVYHILRKSKK